MNNKQISVPASTPDDLLWGAQEIAEHIKRTRSQVYYLIRTGSLPVTRLGRRTIVGRKSELDAALSELKG